MLNLMGISYLNLEIRLAVIPTGHQSHLLQYETTRQRHNVPVMAFVDITKRIYSTSSTIPVIMRAGIAQLVNSIRPLKVVTVYIVQQLSICELYH